MAVAGAPHRDVTGIVVNDTSNRNHTLATAAFLNDDSCGDVEIGIQPLRSISGLFHRCISPMLSN